MTATNSANALEVVGDVSINGILKGGILQPLYIVSNNSASTINLSTFDSGTKLYVDVSGKTFQLGADPANGYCFEFLCDESCVLTPSGGNKIKDLYSTAVPSNASITLPRGVTFRATFINKGSTSSNNFWLLQKSYV